MCDPNLVHFDQLNSENEPVLLKMLFEMRCKQRVQIAWLKTSKSRLIGSEEHITMAWLCTGSINCHLCHVWMQCGRVVIPSVACLCVCLVWALTCENFDLEIPYLVRRYIFNIPRSRAYIKVIGSRSRSRQQNMFVFCSSVVCLRLKGNLVSS